MKTTAEGLADIIVARIAEVADKARLQWNNPVGTTTRHFVVDDLLPEEVCREISAAFPADGRGFLLRESPRERKLTSAKLDQYPAILSAITNAIQDPRVVAAVAEIAGLEKIDPDPMLYAGGLSMMTRDHFLNPHIDNSHDAARDRYRRINALFYVTPDWTLPNGGHLELWNAKASVPVVVESRFNRLVIMETNKTSLHSVSPVTADGYRCCVSSYYFSEESPDGSEYFHVTSFNGRPGQTLRRLWGPLDNLMRQTYAVAFKAGRGKDQMRA